MKDKKINIFKILLYTVYIFSIAFFVFKREYGEAGLSSLCLVITFVLSKAYSKNLTILDRNLYIVGNLFTQLTNNSFHVELIGNSHLLYQDIPQQIRNRINISVPDCVPYKIKSILSKKKINNNFIKASFSVDKLINWFVLDKYVNEKNFCFDEYTIRLETPPSIEIKLTDKIKLKFNFIFKYGYTSDGKYEQYFDVFIDLLFGQMLLFDELLSVISTVQLFFCFITDRVLDIKGPIKLYDNIDSSYHIAELITEGNWSDIRPLTTQTLFNFSFIEERFEEIMQKWVDFVFETDPSIFIYLENREDSAKYLTTKYLMAWQTIESLGKTLNINSTCSMRQSVVRLTQNDINKGHLGYFYFPKYFHLIIETQWSDIINILYDTRNSHTHILENKAKILPPGKLEAGCKVLELIYQVNVLGALGFSDDKIYSIINNNSNRYITGKIKAIYEIIEYLNMMD